MEKYRTVKKIIEGTATSDGAGVKLSRVYGKELAELFDPFLLLDVFRSEDPKDYIAGFPWHPHRGIETVTYLIHGSVEHGDSLGNKGVISSGDCQWMTAGSGIIHMEMPKESELMWGCQLWVNLPSNLKMTPPKYRDIGASDVKTIDLEGKGTAKIICGSYNGIEGPLKGISVDPVFIDVDLKSNQEFTYKIDTDHNLFLYIMGGSGYMDPSADAMVGNMNLVLFNEGENMLLRSGSEGIRFLLLSGKPIREPIAWGGPIVMNTQEELSLAFEEYQNGTFIK